MVTLRVITLAGCLVGVGVWLVWARRNPKQKLYAAPMLTWLVNVAAFYGTRIVHVAMPVEALNLWSVMIHLHALALIVTAGCVFMRGAHES